MDGRDREEVRFENERTCIPEDVRITEGPGIW